MWCTELAGWDLILIGWDGEVVETLRPGRSGWYGLTFAGDELWGGPTSGFDGSVWRIVRGGDGWGTPIP